MPPGTDSDKLSDENVLKAKAIIMIAQLTTRAKARNVSLEMKSGRYQLVYLPLNEQFITYAYFNSKSIFIFN